MLWPKYFCGQRIPPLRTQPFGTYWVAVAAIGGIPPRANDGHSNYLHQVGLARVERAQLGHTDQLGGGDAPDSQRPAANG